MCAQIANINIKTIINPQQYFVIILKLCLYCFFQVFPILPCSILSYITYFTTLAFHLKEIFVIESLYIAYRSPFIYHSRIYCCQTLSIAPCALYSLIVSLRFFLSMRANCHFADWLWKRSSNRSLLWRGSPYLLLLSLCLWELAAAHWRSYMTVKRAINSGREAEVYGCLSLP